MNNITITISINDWRDVPVDDSSRRKAILNAIIRAAEWAADEKAELHDVVIKTKYEIS